jgi:hypothetical protein
LTTNNTHPTGLITTLDEDHHTRQTNRPFNHKNTTKGSDENTMAEQMRPRPSKSEPIQSNNGDDEDQETFQRQPDPVQPGDRFFDRPALAFNPASMPLEVNEQGLFVKAGTSEVNKDLTKDSRAAGSDATRDLEDETMDDPIDLDAKETQSSPSLKLFTTAHLTSQGADKANQEGGTTTSRATSKSTLQDLINPATTTTSTSRRPVFEQSVKPPTFNSTVFSTDNNGFTSRITSHSDKDEVEHGEQEQESVNQEEQDREVGNHATLFPVSQPDRGLVLAVNEQGDDDQHVPDEEEDEEIPVSYPSLSELSPSKGARKEPQQPFEPSTAAAIPTLPESTNVKRWDLGNDEELSDADIDLDFVNPRSNKLQDSQDSMYPAVPSEAAAESRVSPFAAFLDAAPLRSSTQQSRDELSRSGRKGKQVKASQSDDESDHDIKDYVGAAVLAGGALLAKKILRDKDSGDEKDSTGDVDLASLLREPLSKFLGSQSNPAGSGMSSTSDDGMFAGGVGGIVKTLLDASSQKQGDDSDDTTSEAFIPRLSAAEKGKQVIREDQAAPVTQRESLDDLPPINSLADKTFGSVGTAPVLDMLSPTPVTPPAPTIHGPRSGIYPAAPPEPWGPGSIRNTLSQRRSPINNVKADSADSKDAFNHDPNLAFAILPRKNPTAAQPKPAEGVRSLLSDYPDVVPKPAAASVPTVTLPADPTKAPVLRGRYELPSINKIDQWKSKNGLAPNAFRRLIFNILALFVSNRVMKGRIYK